MRRSIEAEGKDFPFCEIELSFTKVQSVFYLYFLHPAHIHIQCSMKVDLIGHVSKFQEEINRRMYHLVLNRGTSINYVNLSDFVNIAVK